MKSRKSVAAVKLALASALLFTGVANTPRVARAAEPAVAPTVQPEKAGQIKYTESKLANGMRVIAVEDFSCPVVAVQVWYHVGSKDENPERQGFAHMFEHMMFRGTDRLGPKEHFDLIRKSGGDCNAYTSFDQTVYINKLPAHQFQLAMWLESERMAFLKIDQSSFSTERAVVEEERRLGLNRPYGTLSEKIFGQLYKVHPYRWTPIGQIPHLRAASIADLAKFWETYYVPNNATLVVVGAVKADEVAKQADRYFGWIPAGDAPPRVTALEPEQTAQATLKIVEPKGPLPIVGYVWRTAGMASPDIVKMDLLASILGGGESSRLNKDLVKDKEIAVQTQAGQENLEQDGLLQVIAVLKPGAKNQDEIFKALDAQVARLVADGVTPEELDKAKANLLKGQVGASTTVESLAGIVGSYAVLLNDLPRMNRRFDDIRAVTTDDIKAVAAKYLTESRRNVLSVEPAGFGEMLRNMSKTPDDGPPPAPVEGNPVAARTGPKATAVRPNNFPTTAPVAPAVTDIPQRDTQTKMLANGLKVVVVRDTKVPLVTMTLGLKHGAYTEDVAHAGSAALAGQLLTEGTENYDSKKLAEELDRHAISLGGSVGMDGGTVNASSLTEDADRATRLLAEVVRRPTFPETEFKRVKQQNLASMAVNEQTPQYLVGRELRRRIWTGGHPYARNAAGESTDLRKLTRDDVVKWWSTKVRPETSVLYFAGDITADAGFALAEKYLGDWKVAGTVTETVVPPTPPRSQTAIYLVDKPGSVQSQILVGQTAITRQNPAWATARVTSQIFGGSFGSRLNETLRVKKGLTYGAGGGFSAERFGGSLSISTFTKTPTTGETVSTILEETRRLADAPVTDEELSSSKSFITGSFPGDRETPQATIGDLWLIEQNNLPADYLKKMLDGVSATSESDVRRLASEVVDPTKLVIVVVGDASKIQADLEKIAPVTVVSDKAVAPTTAPAK